MSKYVIFFEKALSKVESSYFKMVMTYSNEEINRERVFCYELYHQMRTLSEKKLPSGELLSLHAEVDKSGNPLFNRQNPDFIFHKPGTNEHNELVCEVKGTIDDGSGITKDFKNILTLIINNGYKNGLFILYNHGIEQLGRRKHWVNSAVMQLADSVQDSHLKAVSIMAIPQSGRAVECVSLFDFLNSNT